MLFLKHSDLCEGHPETEANTAPPLPEQEVFFEGICCAWHLMASMNYHTSLGTPGCLWGQQECFLGQQLCDTEQVPSSRPQLPLTPGSWRGAEASSHSWYEQELWASLMPPFLSLLQALDCIWERI